MKATWVKKRVLKKQADILLQNPAYLSLYENDNEYIVAFRVVGELPTTVESCNMSEEDALEKKRKQKCLGQTT